MVLMYLKKYDYVWFSCRAVAESVKTESWRFMMKVKPYDNTISDPEAEDRFIANLKEILYRLPSVSSEITSHIKEGDQITERMREVRNKTLEDRKVFYIQNRIRDQIDWYATKSDWNRNKYSQWFFLTWFLQFAAIAVAVITIICFSYSLIRPVGLITTAAAGAMTWMHSKSYRELNQSYGLIAQELSFLEVQAKRVTTEKELADIVMDVERTISREHIIWLTRRFRES